MGVGKGTRARYFINLWTTTAGTGTLDGRLQGSANSNFTGNTNLAGTNITQLTANNTGTSTEISAEALTQINATYRYVRLHITGATNAVTCSAIGLTDDSIQKPNSLNNLNTTFFTAGVTL